MLNRRQTIGYVLSAGFVLALLVAAFLRTTPAAGRALKVWEREGHPGRYQTTFPAMGSDVKLEVAAADAGQARRMFLAAAAKIILVDELMSTYRDDSEVSRLNAAAPGEWVAISPDTMKTLQESVRFSRLSGGAFDVTYAPLRALWRKAAADNKLPTQEELDAARAAVGSDGLLLNDGRASFAKPGMEVDLGGIAAGYSIDLAIDAMRQAGATSAIVDISGDIRFLGKPDAREKWRVQVTAPPHVTEQLVLEVGDCSVATSGDYERYFLVGGKNYSHIVDPRTGWPVTSVPSATVVAADAITADAMSTAISVLGAQEGVKLIDSLPGVECMIMVRKADGSVEEYQSSGFAALIGSP